MHDHRCRQEMQPKGDVGGARQPTRIRHVEPHGEPEHRQAAGKDHRSAWPSVSPGAKRKTKADYGPDQRRHPDGDRNRHAEAQIMQRNGGRSQQRSADDHQRLTEIGPPLP